MGRGLAEVQGWPLPCSTPTALLPTLLPLSQAGMGMGKAIYCVQGHTVLSLAALPLLMQSFVVNRKTKFIFKHRIKGGRKRLLREAGLLVPGEPQTELQICLSLSFAVRKLLQAPNLPRWQLMEPVTQSTVTPACPSSPIPAMTTPRQPGNLTG